MLEVEEEEVHEGDNELLLESLNDIADQFMIDTCNHYDAWKSFHNLGCTWNGRYRVPGYPQGIDLSKRIGRLHFGAQRQ